MEVPQLAVSDGVVGGEVSFSVSMLNKRCVERSVLGNDDSNLLPVGGIVSLSPCGRTSRHIIRSGPEYGLTR